MRTTVSLDDELYDEARRIAFESKRTLGEVVNELLGEGLKARNSPKAPRVLGRLRGTIEISDDFDETPAEILEALDSPVTP